MSGYGLRPAGAGDAAWVQRLNTENVAATSPLTVAETEALLAAAAMTRVADPEAAFLVTFDQNGAYDSPNFLWFRARYPRFLYVDRIVVSAAHRRQGLAAMLYDALFHHAQSEGYPVVTAEINSDPPNPGSDAFHDALGFRTAGEARLEDRGKTVRYIVREMG